MEHGCLSIREALWSLCRSNDQWHSTMKLLHQNLDSFATKAIPQDLSQYLCPLMERLKIGET